MIANFVYSQILPTAHPLFEITVNFYCIADVEGEEVELLALKGYVETQGRRTMQESLPLPDESIHAGAMFAGVLRQAARDEAYRLSKLQNQTT